MKTTTTSIAVSTLLLSALTLIPDAASADSVEPSARVCFDVSGDPGDIAVVNLTPVGSLAKGSGQLVSSDLATPPVYSNVNFEPGVIDPNVALAEIGSDGQTCFVNNSPDRTGIIADHLGTIDAASYTVATPSGAPARVVDTRSGVGGNTLDPGDRRCFSVDGAPGDAAVVNLTPVLASGTGNGRLLSSDVATAPAFSNVNYSIDSIDPNVAISQIGTDGQVCFENDDLASVDLIADHMGTISTDSYTAATPSGASTRVVDTRSGTGGTTLTPSARLCVAVDGSPGDAAVVNLTPVRATTVGNGQLVSSDLLSPPVFSNVNWTPGSVDPNVAVTTIGTDGQVCFVNNAPGNVDLIADFMGSIAASAYTPATATGAPVRALDSRLTASIADLVLLPAGVGSAAFSRDDASTIAYFSSALGAPISDDLAQYPIPNSSPGFEDAEENGFTFPHGRTTCFANGFCAQFGGMTPTTLTFVGYAQSGFTPPSEPLKTTSGVTIGTRGDDIPGAITVPTGGCFSVGEGTADGIAVLLQSDGVQFAEPTPSGDIVFNMPPLSDVVVLSIFAGDRPFQLFADC